MRNSEATEGGVRDSITGDEGGVEDESARQRQRCGGSIPTQAFEAPTPSDSLVAQAQNSL